MTGHLMAGGMMLSLNCDLRVGLAGTKAGITESSRPRLAVGRAAGMDAAAAGADGIDADRQPRCPSSACATWASSTTWAKRRTRCGPRRWRWLAPSATTRRFPVACAKQSILAAMSVGCRPGNGLAHPSSGLRKRGRRGRPAGVRRRQEAGMAGQVVPERGRKGDAGVRLARRRLIVYAPG